MNMEVTGLDDFAATIQRLGEKAEPAIKAAMYDAAAQLRAAVETEVQNLPTEPNRYLRDNEKYNVFTETNKADLLAGIYVHKFQQVGDRLETWVSFDGYGSPSTATKKYPQGLPNAMIANAINSGSSVRRKNRFMARAKKAGEPAARAAMQETFEEYLKKEGLSNG